MTRFARAKGSKASNEKLREEATPWHVMKEQLEESLNKEKPIEEKTKTARQLLQEKELSAPPNNDWAEFDVPKVSKKSTKFQGSSKIEKPTGNKVKKNKLKESLQKQAENNTDLLQDVSVKIKSKKQVAEKLDSQQDTPTDSVPAPKKNNKQRKLEKSEKKVKRAESQQDLSESTPAPKKKKLDKADVNESAEVKVPQKKNIVDSEKPVENSTTVGEESKPKPTGKLSKRQKRNLKKKNQNSEAQNIKSKKSVFDTEDNDWNSDVKFGSVNEESDKKPGPLESGEDQSKKGSQNRNNNTNQEKFGRFGEQKPGMKNHHLRKQKIKDDKEHKRRKPVQSTKLVINGMEIEVSMYDGFPVQKEDAERLKELKQKMILKGIPKSEIDAAIKLERRKAEKSLARIRKQVCFHCRKAGHNLSDCPELGKEESATGICFKCGSTEHTHFECKVTKSDDYRYATCFICREPGHIAKQCPDNPKGLYPKGGACNICGDVTHLKKDCPDSAREKEETTLTVKTIKDSALESLDEEAKKVEPKTEPKKKIVKF